MKILLVVVLILSITSVCYSDDDSIKIVNDEGVVFTLSEPPTDITFSCYENRTVNITKNDMLSMSEEEIRNTVLFINVLRNVYISNDIMCIWGEKLLPRFCKKDERTIR